MIPFNVEFADGTRQTVDARPFAIELWERETKQKMFALADGAGLGDFLRIVYYELKLSGAEVGKYDDWAATVVSIIEDEDPKAPAGQASPA